MDTSKWVWCYKIVRNVDGRYFSLTSVDPELEKGTVEYGEKIITKPKRGCGPLAVFSTMGSAKDFLRTVSPDIYTGVIEIWLCCTYDPAWGEDLYIGKKYPWSTPKTKKYRASLPDGTILVRGIELRHHELTIDTSIPRY